MHAAATLRRLLGYARERHAIAALEFALVTPLMATALLGSMDVAMATITSRKLSAATYAIADIASIIAVQQNGNNSLTSAQAAIATNAVYGVFPAWKTDGTAFTVALTLSGVVFNAQPAGCVSNCTYVPEIAWSAGNPTGLQALRPCGTPTSVANTSASSPTTLPVGVYGATSLLVADIAYSYQPTFFNFITGPIAMNHSSYLPPRIGYGVTFVLAQGETGDGKDKKWKFKGQEQRKFSAKRLFRKRKKMTCALYSTLREFFRSRRGNVALIFGLTLVPLLGVVGLAIDFGGAATAKSRLDIALDAAALLGTTYVSNAVASGQPNAIGDAQSQAVARFNAQAGSIPWTAVTSLSAVVTNSGGVSTSTVAYGALYQTSFGKMFGVPTITMKNTASSKLVVNLYADISVLMDVSSSMGIAATTADITKMTALTKGYKPAGTLPGNVNLGEGCAFGCHWTNTYDDYYKLAGRNGVTLRIDVLRSALGNLISSMNTLNTAKLFRLGLYTFNSALTTIYPLSADIASASGSLPKVALGLNDCSNNCPETYIANAISGMTTTVGTSGSGASPATSRKYLFLISDGLVDQVTGNSRVIGPIDPSICSALKANGVTIMVLYTPYLPLPTNAFYNSYVAPIQANISPSLQSCASSPALFYQAGDAAGIDLALQQMLVNATTSPGHFTQ